MAKVQTIHEDCDILIIGGGMAGTGATFESRHWGRDLKIVCVEKANIDRSGAVAQGLYAINCYMGMQWDEINQKIMLGMQEMTSWDWSEKI